VSRLAPVLCSFAAVATIAGCGGSAGTSSGTNASGTVTATVVTSTTRTSTTAHANASFNAQFSRVQQQLSGGLRKIESGKLGSIAVGSNTVLSNCTNSVSNQLGARARTPQQQQAVSNLRTACDDIAQAVSKLKSGDTSAAGQLARTALQEVQQANATSK
jgi:hypothetical protein